ncbi:MAG: dockerin type I repeat-containing protein [Phycisphaerales bacterium]
MRTRLESALVPVGLSLAGAAAALAQPAPSTAQMWEVVFAADESGPLAAGPDVTAVGITMSARITILPGTHNTANFGISRVGGALFRMTFVDEFAAGQGLSQGSLGRGETRAVDARTLIDTAAQPLAGMFAPLRGSFQPQVAPMFLGSNTEANNGQFTNPVTGSPFVTNVIGGRTFNFGADGTGPYGHMERVPVYRVVYTPRPGPPRMVRVDVTNIGARYIYAVSGSTGQAASAVTLPNQSLVFQVGVRCPEVTSQPVDQRPCMGGSASFSVSASGHAPTMRYQWRIDGTPLVDSPPAPPPTGMVVAGATGPTLTLSAVPMSPARMVDCVVTNACGNVTSAGVSLAVLPPECCRRDVNVDGVVNADDLGDLINRYFANPQAESADFNADGFIDADDLGDFLNFYFGDQCAAGPVTGACMIA